MVPPTVLLGMAACATLGDVVRGTAGRAADAEPLGAMGAGMAPGLLPRLTRLPQLRERAYCRIASFTR
jgi:hypothetical protein